MNDEPTFSELLIENVQYGFIATVSVHAMKTAMTILMTFSI